MLKSAKYNVGINQRELRILKLMNELTTEYYKRGLNEDFMLT